MSMGTDEVQDLWLVSVVSSKITDTYIIVVGPSGEV